MEQVTRAITGKLSSEGCTVVTGRACQICGKVSTNEFFGRVICQECGKRLRKLLYENVELEDK